MKSALSTQKDGVAIAAPQIGESLRMFLVSDHVMKLADKEYKSLGKDIIFINPKITKLSKEKYEAEEGCLSVRWKYGKVERSVKATVKGYNELGEKVERGASGLLAQVFQHETEHLDGILFIDKAYDVQDLPPEAEDKTL
jgi:peptide deformylase